MNVKQNHQLNISRKLGLLAICGIAMSGIAHATPRELSGAEQIALKGGGTKICNTCLRLTTCEECGTNGMGSWKECGDPVKKCNFSLFSTCPTRDCHGQITRYYTRTGDKVGCVPENFVQSDYVGCDDYRCD